MKLVEVLFSLGAFSSLVAAQRPPIILPIILDLPTTLATSTTSGTSASTSSSSSSSRTPTSTSTSTGSSTRTSSSSSASSTSPSSSRSSTSSTSTTSSSSSASLGPISTSTSTSTGSSSRTSTSTSTSTSSSRSLTSTSSSTSTSGSSTRTSTSTSTSTSSSSSLTSTSTSTSSSSSRTSTSTSTSSSTSTSTSSSTTSTTSTTTSSTTTSSSTTTTTTAAALRAPGALISLRTATDQSLVNQFAVAPTTPAGATTFNAQRTAASRFIFSLDPTQDSTSSQFRVLQVSGTTNYVLGNINAPYPGSALPTAAGTHAFPVVIGPASLAVGDESGYRFAFPVAEDPTTGTFGLALDFDIPNGAGQILASVPLVCGSPPQLVLADGALAGCQTVSLALTA